MPAWYALCSTTYSDKESVLYIVIFVLQGVSDDSIECINQWSINAMVTALTMIPHGVSGTQCCNACSCFIMAKSELYCLSCCYFIGCMWLATFLLFGSWYQGTRATQILSLRYDCSACVYVCVFFCDAWLYRLD